MILDLLRERVHGEVLQPGDEGYDEARTIWNGLVDKEPTVIVRCTGVADVIASVVFASENSIRLAVKGGGHHIAGHAVCNDGLVIDLSSMNSVRVDPDSMTVRVEGGATWGDVNHEIRAFGLETAGSRYPNVGVAGYTLGGGMGYLTRTHGLAIDNLCAVDVVTADGELVHASENENPDLFWGLRGGSGNFGIVTSFEFDCHDVPAEVLTGQFLHPVEDAKNVLRFYREFMADAPDKITAAAGILQVPSHSEFPAELHGETIIATTIYYMGDIEDGERTLQPLKEFGEPVFTSVHPEPYSETGINVEADQRNHWKSHFFAELSDEAIDTFVEQAVPLPTPSTVIVFFSLGGAMNRIDEDATAFPHRDAAYLFEIVTQWKDPDTDTEFTSWAQKFHEAMAPYATGGEYVNNQTEDTPERAKAAYSDNFDRLVEVKTEWDPENLFRMNQNIEPTV